MAKNTGKGYRKGAVDNRSQTYNPKTDQYVKRDTETGKFMDNKQDGKPFKGVRKEEQLTFPVIWAFAQKALYFIKLFLWLFNQYISDLDFILCLGLEQLPKDFSLLDAIAL